MSIRQKKTLYWLLPKIIFHCAKELTQTLCGGMSGITTIITVNKSFTIFLTRHNSLIERFWSNFFPWCLVILSSNLSFFCTSSCEAHILLHLESKIINSNNVNGYFNISRLAEPLMWKGPGCACGQLKPVVPWVHYEGAKQLLSLQELSIGQIKMCYSPFLGIDQVFLSEEVKKM